MNNNSSNHSSSSNHSNSSDNSSSSSSSSSRSSSSSSSSNSYCSSNNSNSSDNNSSKNPRGLAEKRREEGPDAGDGRVTAHVRFQSTANLRTKILDFRGLDSSRIVNSRVGIPRPIGNFLKSLSQAILALHLWDVLLNASNDLGDFPPSGRGSCRAAASRGPTRACRSPPVFTSYFLGLFVRVLLLSSPVPFSMSRTQTS